MKARGDGNSEYSLAESAATAALSHLENVLEQLSSRLRIPNIKSRVTADPALLDKCRALCVEAETEAANADSKVQRLLELVSGNSGGGDSVVANKHVADRIARSLSESKVLLAELAAQVAAIISSNKELRPSSQASVALGDDNDSGDENNNDTPLLRLQQQQLIAQDAAAQREAAYNQALIAEREADIRNIESGLVMVQDVFVKIGSLVTEQGHDIDHIESNIEDANFNAESGAAELNTANQRASNANWCKCVVFLVLLGACSILGIFVYLKASASLPPPSYTPVHPPTPTPTPQPLPTPGPNPEIPIDPSPTPGPVPVLKEE